MKDARINTVRDGVVEVGASFGTSEHGPGHDYDQPDGIFLSIERDSFGHEDAGVVHFDVAGIRRLRKVLKRALNALEPPAPKPGPEPESTWAPKTTIETYMQGEVSVGPAIGYKPSQPLLSLRLAKTTIETYMQGEVSVGPAIGYKPSQPLLSLRLAKNTWDQMSLGPRQLHGDTVVHFTEEQFDALVKAGNRRFGRA